MRQRALFAVACLCFGAAVLVVVRRGLYSETTQVRPYTASFAVTMTNESGRQTTLGRRIALRGDGAKLVENTDPQGPVRHLFLPADARLIQFDPLYKTKSTRHIDPGVFRSVMEPMDHSPDCSGVAGGAKMVGSGSFLGFNVIKYTSESGHIVRYFAPALNCLNVRSEYQWGGQDGKPTSTTVREAVAIQVGEPDPLLFEVPTGLTEMTPSQRILTRLRGHQLATPHEHHREGWPPACLRRFLENEDSDYIKNAGR